MANGALSANPGFSDISITTHGSDFLWAVFAVMLLSALIFSGLAHRRPVEARIFHYIAAAICFTAAVAYFSMASNLGQTPIPVEYRRNYDVGGGDFPTRAIWYARYIDWTITTPLLLLELLLVTGLPLSSVFITIFWDLVMIVTGLIGALVASSYKWGFFAMGMFALVYVWYMLLGPARQSSMLLGPQFHSSYVVSASILSFLWLLYPIAWGLSDGGNVIHPDSEMVFYGVLDVLAKPVFCFIHLTQLSKITFPALTFNSNLPGHASVVEKAVGVTPYNAGVSAPAAAGTAGLATTNHTHTPITGAHTGVGHTGTNHLDGTTGSTLTSGQTGHAEVNPITGTTKTSTNAPVLAV